MVAAYPHRWTTALCHLLVLSFFGVTNTNGRTSTNNREFDWTKTIQSIGCFVCTSINHNNPQCEDTFNNTGDFYKPHCWAPRKDRMGTFPGTQCIKLVMENAEDNMHIVVRNCVVDNGGTTADTEIGRQSHCGWMRQMVFKDRKVQGCLLACNRDGCNAASTKRPAAVIASFSALVAFFSSRYFDPDRESN